MGSPKKGNGHYDPAQSDTDPLLKERKMKTRKLTNVLWKLCWTFAILYTLSFFVMLISATFGDNAVFRGAAEAFCILGFPTYLCWLPWFIARQFKEAKKQREFIKQ